MPLTRSVISIGAMNNFGLLYVRNNGVKRNFFDARHWFEKAAAGGNAAATNNLGPPSGSRRMSAATSAFGDKQTCYAHVEFFGL